MTKHILIIDDDDSILSALEFLLTKEGYAVTASSYGKDALQLIQCDKPLPDLLILDIMLPGYDGREIAKSLKTNSKTKNLPIIMISAHVSSETSVKECGANIFIPKPFDISKLLDSIEKVN